MSLAVIEKMMAESCMRGIRHIWSGKWGDKRCTACQKNWCFCMLLWQGICVPLNSGDVCCDLISYICFCIVVSFPLLSASIPFLSCLHAASCVFLPIVGDSGLLRAFIDIDCMLFCAFEECLLVLKCML